ncbi:acyltransferase [Sphingomonas bacterium]|uniref:acyltransferase family protein n=1 Tax=Sphingomonas bacterium TaxID=1895847 RepID=UPI00260382B6|nr:acyltransferase [Sphingomonas bacterium]MDB5677666.1 acyltransferase [Sphingomonas bacterium]
MNAATANQRIAAIDVSRLVAAIGVLVFHVAGTSLMPKYKLPPFTVFGRTVDWMPSPFSFGATGVSLFFVISGYCMFRSLSGRPRPLAAYYRDRLARLYPIYAFAVILSAILIARLHIAVAGEDVVLKLLFLHGFVQQYNLTFNGALWSMATEVQFYLVLPLLMIWARRAGTDRFTTAAIIGSLLFRAVVQLTAGHTDTLGGIARDTLLMNMLPGRIAEFAVGMWIASNDSERTRRFAWWLIIPGALLGIGAKAAGPAFVAEPMLGIFFGSLLVLALDQSRRFGSVAGPFALLGRASYALFLIHLPIANSLARLVPEGWPLYHRFGTLLVTTLGISIPLALALHLWVEMPLFDRLRASRNAKRPASAATDGGAP